MAQTSLPWTPRGYTRTADDSEIVVDLEYDQTKRLVDVCGAALLCWMLAPLMVVVAILIHLDSAGPVFYRQRRIGRNGREFDMLKFRSMYTGSDVARHQEAIRRYMDGEQINADNPNMPFKLGDDPRITRVGKFIRKTSIDELPQVFNVLVGQMSLVGPRPPLPYEVSLYGPREMLRLVGQPGMTGEWQVRGRGRVPFHEMIEMDLTYLRRQSISYDFFLMLATIPVMLMGLGGA